MLPKPYCVAANLKRLWHGIRLPHLHMAGTRGSVITPERAKSAAQC